MKKSVRLLGGLILVVGLILTMGLAVAAGTDRYVDPAGTDSGDCSVSACQTIGYAVGQASAGDTIHVAAGTYAVSSQINLNKADLTLAGAGSGSTTVQVSGTGYRFYITANGVTIDGFKIEKTDKTGLQNIIYIGADDVAVTNNVIHGQYVLGDGDTTRAFEVAYGSTGLVIEGNTIHSLRQPGYLNGSLASPTTGSIANNYIYGTRGWVLAGANMTYTGNTWGTGANANVYDIVILSGTDASYYPDIVAVSEANNNAVVEDQRPSPAVLSDVFVDASVVGPGTGGPTDPYPTIGQAIPRAVAGGTVYVAAGMYAGNVTINKSLTLLGDPGDASAGPGVNAPAIDGGSTPGSAFFIANGVSNVTIRGFEMRNFTSNSSGVGNGISAWVGSTSNITIQDNYFHDLEYNGILVGNDYSTNPSKWGDHTNWLIKGNVADRIVLVQRELDKSPKPIRDSRMPEAPPNSSIAASSAPVNFCS